MTKKTKSKIFPVIYHIENVDRLSDLQMNELLLCGDSNWNYYFVKLIDKITKDYERMENVELLEFENEKEMFIFIKTLNPFQFLDYSTSHAKPSVLRLTR